MSNNLMASCFCCSVLRLFLEGQLILATVATQAARNSRGTCGKFALKTGFGFSFSATFWAFCSTFLACTVSTGPASVAGLATCDSADISVCACFIALLRLFFEPQDKTVKTSMETTQRLKNLLIIFAILTYKIKVFICVNS